MGRCWPPKPDCPHQLQAGTQTTEDSGDMNWDDPAIWDYIATFVSGPEALPSPTPAQGG